MYQTNFFILSLSHSNIRDTEMYNCYSLETFKDIIITSKKGLCYRNLNIHPIRIQVTITTITSTKNISRRITQKKNYNTNLKINLHNFKLRDKLQGTITYRI